MMKIDIPDEVLGNFVPFAVLVFKPPDHLMAHLIHHKEDPRSLPEDLAAELLRGVLKPECQFALVDPSGPQN